MDKQKIQLQRLQLLEAFECRWSILRVVVVPLFYGSYNDYVPTTGLLIRRTPNSQTTDFT